VTVPATTVSETAAQRDIDVTIKKGAAVVCPIPFLPAGYKINIVTSKTIAAGLEVSVHGWDY
jgi:hypothetical protein